ncbi:hypothetical protein D3C71_676470 [compost metagenome]
MLAVALQRQRGRRHRFHCAHGITFDARHLHKPGNRITGHAEMMLERDLRGIFHLLRRSAHDRGKTRRRHGGSRTHLALTAHFRA